MNKNLFIKAMVDEEENANSLLDHDPIYMTYNDHIFKERDRASPEAIGIAKF